MADTDHHRVQVLKYPDLVFFSTIGKEGIDRGQFPSPHAADRCNHRIQVFGEVLEDIHILLNEPIGVTIDNSDIL